MTAKHVLSFGAGVNSTAILVGAMEKGDRKPDVILFADTGGEKPATYEHLETMQTWCKCYGFPQITVVRDKVTLDQDCLDRGTLPGKAFGFGSCSDHFKVRPQNRWLREQGIADVVWWVGFHRDEPKRIARALHQRSNVRFPLVEWGWGQDECEAVLLKWLIQKPCKSACFFCPAMRKREVLELAKDSPELFARAVEMERNAKDSGTLNTIKGLGRRWSWESLVQADADQLRLFADDQDDVCDVCVDW